MDRTVVIPLSAAIAHGHRVQVVERVDEAGGRTPIAVTDLETGVRYGADAEPGADSRTWTGHVLECRIAPARTGTSTTLLIDRVGSGAAEADDALREADAAADAARDEARRWGGADRRTEPESPRFW